MENKYVNLEADYNEPEEDENLTEAQILSYFLSGNDDIIVNEGFGYFLEDALDVLTEIESSKDVEVLTEPFEGSYDCSDEDISLLYKEALRRTIKETLEELSQEEDSESLPNVLDELDEYNPEVLEELQNKLN